MTNIAIFASGTGSNAEKLIAHFKQIPRSNIKISLVLSNNPNAKVLEKAKQATIKTAVFSNEDFKNASKVLDYLKHENINWIILAGFLRKIPTQLIQAFPNSI